jgi:hypothetical protein
MLRSQPHLIASHHHNTSSMHRLHSSNATTNRRSHSLAGLFIQTTNSGLYRSQQRTISNHNNHRSKPSLPRHTNRASKQRLSTNLNRLLRPTQPPRAPCSQHHSSNAHNAHAVCRYREAPPRATCSAINSGVIRRICGSFSARQACISATVANAIASAPSPPRSSPIGA